MEYGPSTQSLALRPADAAASIPHPGNLGAIISRIEEAVDEETAAIRTDIRFDIKASNARKSRYLYELARAMKGVGEAGYLAEHREGVDLPPGTRVFVSALEHNGRGQPLAARLLTVGDLPATVKLTNADAVGPFNLSSADMIYVVATASASGTANVQSGDYQARSEPFQHAGSHAMIDLRISEPVTP